VVTRVDDAPCERLRLRELEGRGREQERNGKADSGDQAEHDAVAQRCHADRVGQQCEGGDHDQAGRQWDDVEGVGRQPSAGGRLVRGGPHPGLANGGDRREPHRPENEVDHGTDNDREPVDAAQIEGHGITSKSVPATAGDTTPPERGELPAPIRYIARAESRAQPGPARRR
jgi:hypothetical protein